MTDSDGVSPAASGAMARFWGEQDIRRIRGSMICHPCDELCVLADMIEKGAAFLPEHDLPRLRKTAEECEILRRHLKAIVDHWNEFGGEYGMDVWVDAAYRFLNGLPQIRHEDS